MGSQNTRCSRCSVHPALSTAGSKASDEVYLTAERNEVQVHKVVLNMGVSELCPEKTKMILRAVEDRVVSNVASLTADAQEPPWSVENNYCKYSECYD
jgi:ribosomal protein L5